MSAPILCYAKDNRAWFTTAPLTQQNGDDWDDAPYEHNAGTPYTYGTWMENLGYPDYELYTLMYVTVLAEPCDDYTVDRLHGGSPCSVDDINNGKVPWFYDPDNKNAGLFIEAGATIFRFCEIMARTGTVFASVRALREFPTLLAEIADAEGFKERKGDVYL